MSLPAISIKVEKSLRDIGLTEYECQAYLALVNSGELTAGKTSEMTKIPYSKVYSVLDNLERKGWVEVKGGRPRLYYPRSPVEAIRAAQIKQENKFEQNKNQIVTELQPLYEQRDVKEKPEIWIIRGVENVASKIKEILDNVKKELMVVVPEIPYELSPLIIPSLISLRDKRLDIFLLTTPEIIHSVKDYVAHAVEIRITDDLFGGGVVADSTESLIFLGHSVTEEQNFAIWSDHIGINMIAKIYFEHLWNNASSYEHQ
jgi:sugar-specific transcriptional regulator TrmB